MQHDIQFKDIEETTVAMADAAALAARRKAAVTGVKELMKMAEKALIAEIEEATCETNTDLDEAVFIARCVLVEAATRIESAISGVGDAGRTTYQTTYCQCDKAARPPPGPAVLAGETVAPTAKVMPTGVTPSGPPPFVPPPFVPPPFVPPPPATAPSGPPPSVPPTQTPDGAFAARGIVEALGRRAQPKVYRFF